MYTDGLIERRDRHLDEGLSELRELLSKPALNVGELCDAALTLALETSPEDDICLLAFSSLADQAAPGTRRLALAAVRYP
jgi:hypothetical protein